MISVRASDPVRLFNKAFALCSGLMLVSLAASASPAHPAPCTIEVFPFALKPVPKPEEEGIEQQFKNDIIENLNAASLPCTAVPAPDDSSQLISPDQFAALARHEDIRYLLTGALTFAQDKLVRISIRLDDYQPADGKPSAPSHFDYSPETSSLDDLADYASTIADKIRCIVAGTHEKKKVLAYCFRNYGAQVLSLHFPLLLEAPLKAVLEARRLANEYDVSTIKMERMTEECGGLGPHNHPFPTTLHRYSYVIQGWTGKLLKQQVELFVEIINSARPDQRTPVSFSLTLEDEPAMARAIAEKIVPKLPPPK
jgi:TolB-like protein